MKKTFLLAIATVGALAFAGGCSNTAGQSESPVFVTVNIDQQPLGVNIAAPAAVQIDTMTLQSRRKNPDSVDSLGFSDVQVNSYTVVYKRMDGGTIVPPPETFACGVLLPHDGNATLTNFPVMYASTIQQAPFDELLPFNGGIDRETGRTEIDLSFNITFYGLTVSGKRVQSETASAPLIFQYSAVTTPARSAK